MCELEIADYYILVKHNYLLYNLKIILFFHYCTV